MVGIQYSTKRSLLHRDIILLSEDSISELTERVEDGLDYWIGANFIPLRNGLPSGGTSA